ncbi:hypothetical protein ACWEQ1_26070 [Streptomyces nodosus]
MSDNLFCEHCTEADRAMWPQGASCLPCIRSGAYVEDDPYVGETDAQWRRRLGLRPLYGPGSYDYYDYSKGAENGAIDAEPEADWSCTECGASLPDDAGVRREYCDAACRSKAYRRQS